jgi:hypothetical protein
LRFCEGATTREGPHRWPDGRHTTYSFNLQNLDPGVYTLELTIDGGKPEKYSFTLK